MPGGRGHWPDQLPKGFLLHTCISYLYWADAPPQTSTARPAAFLAHQHRHFRIRSFGPRDPADAARRRSRARSGYGTARDRRGRRRSSCRPGHAHLPRRRRTPAQGGRVDRDAQVARRPRGSLRNGHLARAPAEQSDRRRNSAGAAQRGLHGVRARPRRERWTSCRNRK